MRGGKYHYRDEDDVEPLPGPAAGAGTDGPASVSAIDRALT